MRCVPFFFPLETLDEVNSFIDRIRGEMLDAIAKGERIQIR